jgi:cytochrome c553
MMRTSSLTTVVGINFRLRFIAGIVLGFALATTAAAGGDPVAGREKSKVCAACHGEDGNSPNPAYPRLAGQYANYLERALLDYQSGERQNAIMAGLAAPLSKADIEDLSAYFAGQNGDLFAVDLD